MCLCRFEPVHSSGPLRFLLWYSGRWKPVFFAVNDQLYTQTVYPMGSLKAHLICLKHYTVSLAIHGKIHLLNMQRIWYYVPYQNRIWNNSFLLLQHVLWQHQKAAIEKLQIYQEMVHCLGPNLGCRNFPLTWKSKDSPRVPLTDSLEVTERFLWTWRVLQVSVQISSW